MKPEKSEIVKIRINNAKNTLNEVNILVENKLWNTAVNRLYYACFYAVTALPYNYELDTKTHSGVQNMFGLHFVKTGIINKESGKFYTTILSMRQDADYEDMVSYEQDDVMNLIQPAADLIAAIEIFLLKGYLLNLNLQIVWFVS